MVQRSALPLSTGKNYKVVTLCGSTRFKEQYMEVQKRLTLEGCIVISVGLFGHSGDEEVWKPGTKEMLDGFPAYINLLNHCSILNTAAVFRSAPFFG